MLMQAAEEADKAIQGAAKSGRWVLLKNAHLAITWLDKLEKTMLKLAPHPQFRLFLTAAINPKLPASLLSHSRVFVYEPAAGIKASLLSTLNRIPDSVFSVAPSERGRVLLLLSWLHAVVQERLRYCPLGWSKKYEFGDSDLLTASDTINAWITGVSQGRCVTL
jgi:dynein heavy chain 1